MVIPRWTCEPFLKNSGCLLDHFFDHFDASQASKLVLEIIECTGTVFFSGVGKSGFICNKIAMSLASIGVKSAFLNPLDALHGDIGNCGITDLLVLFSKSGSTAELLAIVPGARSKNMKIVSVTCQSTVLWRTRVTSTFIFHCKESCAHLI